MCSCCLHETSIRAEIEARGRLEYEKRARIEAEARAEELRLENERLAELARKNEEERHRREQEILLEKEKHKRTEDELLRKIEAQMQREALERDRLTEAARQAVLEQKRIDSEKKAIEASAAPVNEHIAAPAPVPTPNSVSQPKLEKREPEWLEPKHARLIFRTTVPVNAISAIKGIVEKTLIDEGKEDIHMHIKAYAIDANTVGMDILKMPASESELLVTIMKALGRGGLGITKITLE